MDTFRSKDFEERIDRIDKVVVKVKSYLLAKNYSAHVENSEGAVIGRGSAKDRATAEAAALGNATISIGLNAAAESFRRSIAHLGGGKES